MVAAPARRPRGRHRSLQGPARPIRRKFVLEECPQLEAREESDAGIRRSGERPVVTANSKMATSAYVPILKAKQGELAALSQLTPSGHQDLSPLVEIRDPTKQVAQLARAWSDAGNILFVHLLGLDYEEIPWADVLRDAYTDLRAADVPFVPVVTIDDGTDVISRTADAVRIDGRGAAIRLDGEGVALAPATVLATELASLLSDLGLGENSCDLIVDLGLVRDSTAARVTTAEAALRVIPNLGLWRNVIVAFSAFPTAVGDVVAAGTTVPIPRDDALAFATLAGRSPGRAIVYSDYAIGTPFYQDTPWSPVPAIRYASGSSWYIHRGTSRSNRSPQYRQLAQDVVGASYFAVPITTGGDQYLQGVASGASGPGNPTTYVTAGTSRHLGCVMDRLARRGVP